MLSSHIEALIRERNNLNGYLRSLLSEVVRCTLEQVARDYRLNSKDLEEKYLERVVDTYVEKESFHVTTKVFCKGKCKDNKPCRVSALANGFCKTHAGQYEDYAARQRFAQQQYERHVNNPMHNHPPTEDEPVAGCPLCCQKYNLLIEQPGE